MLKAFSQDDHLLSRLARRIGLNGSAKSERPADKALLASKNPEIRFHPLVQQCYEQMATPRREIDTQTDDPAEMRMLLDRVIAQWQSLGAIEPYFSNDNFDEFRREKLNPEAVEKFYKMGDDFMQTLAAFESRSEVSIANGVCVELGAGSGKFTHALARRFERVFAVDVSEPLLKNNERRLASLGITNVETRLLRSPEDMSAFENVDLFFAKAVLLANPPPIQTFILQQAFASLRPGGFAWFQTPDWTPNYAFSIKQFLTRPLDAVCDCHCLPKTFLLELLRQQHMDLLDFNSDFLTECSGSFVYFARKRLQGAA